MENKNSINFFYIIGAGFALSIIVILTLALYINYLSVKKQAPKSKVIVKEQLPNTIIPVKKAAIAPNSTLPCSNSTVYTDLSEASKNPSAVCHLILNDKNLSSIPDDFSKFTHLTELSLNHNQLSEIPTQILKLKNLVRLDIAGNKISSIPKEISSLSNLQILNLTNNNLTSLDEKITELRYLTVLQLAGNNITSLPQNIENMPYLSLLTLPKNNFYNKDKIDYLKKTLPHTKISFF